ncbi:ribonuclease H-like domain-containing protein [Thelephora terrestris]|uniref:Ribonuclease H-like domain-containing protein n=1 Tax=Thelephora terrestris TaxID=56493 RepID=A0A9P6L3Q0_9AGAM|nr:ribonuclease H-like domain-containing protein [Thelephora terrestris]
MSPKPTSKILLALDGSDGKGVEKKGSLTAETGKAPRQLQRSKTEPAIPGYQDAQRSRASKALTKTTSDAGPSNTLPVYSYKDHEDPAIVVYTKNEEEANDLIGCLHGPSGFDMEWRFYWLNGRTVSRPTALVQIGDDRIILLVQLSAMTRFPSELKRVIESPDIVKLGVNIRGDGEKLYHDYGILPRGLVELAGAAQDADADFAAMFRRPMVALAKMVEFYEKRHLPKDTVRISDWERDPLDPEQIEYAANDADCAVRMYKKICEIAEEAGKTLTLSKYTTDLKADYDSGKLGMITTSATFTPKNATAELTPQERKTYTLWHTEELSLPELCAALRSKDNPLKESTVISYVFEALQKDKSLPFSLPKLKELIQLEIGSWARHGWWIHKLDAQNRVQAKAPSTSNSQPKDQ